ncbi:MAG: TatD family hydrolase [Patescibacteria group bacterium]
MYIDTHCHLNFAAFDLDWQNVVNKTKAAEVEKMIVVGTEIKSSEKAIEMAKSNSNLLATVGFHPHHVRSLIDLAYARVQICQITDQLKKLGKNKKVVAIGECGLDYHIYQDSKYPGEAMKVDEKLKNLQKQMFGMQIQLAKELKLPLIIHSRDSHEDVLDTLDHFCKPAGVGKNDGKMPKAVWHCISGNKKILEKILEKDFYVGVDANITYSTEVQALAKIIPLNRLLLETDSPYLTPTPNRSKRNTPLSVIVIAEIVAKLKKVKPEKVAEKTTENAKRLFNIQ